MLSRPTHHRRDRDANVVVVEGVLDALAIAATAARGGELSMFAPATASGLTVSAVHAAPLLALPPKPPFLARAGDAAARRAPHRARAPCAPRPDTGTCHSGAPRSTPPPP